MWENRKSDIFDTELDVDMTSLLDLMTMITAVMMLCVPSFSILSTQLAKADGNQSTLDQESCITVSFSKSEQLKWNNEEVMWQDLKSKMETYGDKKERPKILVAGDADASYGFGIRLRAFLSKHGFKVSELAKYERSE